MAQHPIASTRTSRRLFARAHQATRDALERVEELIAAPEPPARSPWRLKHLRSAKLSLVRALEDLELGEFDEPA